MLDASSISVVLDAYRPEREVLLELLQQLSPDDWQRPTECPVYPVKGVATHVLGDDLSLLSRQRDAAREGLSFIEPDMPGSDFRTLIDTFNDRWVAATRYLSVELLVELLALTGEWTASYYESVDPEAPGEAVGLFGAPQRGTSPFWQAIGREYFERWIHHSQIRRALGLGSLADPIFLRPGIEVVAAIGQVEPGLPANADGTWCVGPVELGPSQQAADILTRAYIAEDVRGLAAGPADSVDFFAAAIGKP